MSDNEASEPRPFKSSLWWFALFLAVGVFVSNQIWHRWYNALPPSPRNHAFHFVWPEYIDNTSPRREGETLLVIVSNSQGYGWEVKPEEIYPSILEAARKERGESFRVVNWSIPGARYHDALVAVAAARSIDATHLALIFTPSVVAKFDRPAKAIGTWTSHLFYKLNDPQIRDAIDPEIRARMTDIPMRISMAIGTHWPAWRHRSLPSALIAENEYLSPFFEIRGAGLWFHMPVLRHNNPRRLRVPRTEPALDVQRAVAMLDTATASAPHVFWINMPVRSTFGVKGEDAWRELTALCEDRGITTIDMSTAIKDKDFLSQTHFGIGGHRVFAGKLHEALP